MGTHTATAPADHTTTYGTPPQPGKPCTPDGTTVWATCTYDPDDAEWTITTFDGWLVSSTTTTTNAILAAHIRDTMADWYRNR